MAANPDFIYQPPMTPYLDIIYQDNDLIVLNKSSGLLSVPGRLVEHQDCIQTRVQRVLPSATIVHRLDMATSGIILMALNKPSHVELSRQFAEREISKTYIARLWGYLGKIKGEVNLPLICDWPNRPKQMVDHTNGKPSLTRFRVLKHEKTPKYTTTLVKLMPITGRSHQLRVHMLSLGHPIIGDRLYSHNKALAISERLQLHAHTILFKHPTSHKELSFNAPCTFL